MTENISQKQIYDAITGLRQEIMVEVKDLRKDVDKLQAFQSYIMGIGAVLVIFVGGFASWVWSKITGA